jgi:hypothetical protein
MNVLTVGTNKAPLFQYLPDTFLLIDDGPFIDQLELPKRLAVTHFDVTKHAFNPLKDISYKRARDLISVLDAVFPEGATTLTRKNANFVLLQSLLRKPRRLDQIEYVRDGASKEGVLDATQKIETLLLSPVLKSVLTRPTNMSFKKTIVARLDRAVLGDFDCFVLASLMTSLYPGPVVIPDLGFYGCAIHRALLRQDRLIAGINSFEEVPELRSQLLLAPRKIGSHCTAEDAKVLAGYAGLTPATNAYNTFVEECIE